MIRPGRDRAAAAGRRGGTSARRASRTRILSGPSVPGWLVRLSPGLVLVAAGAVTLDWPQLVVGVVLAAVVTALPNHYLLGLAAAWTGLALMLGTPGGLGWQSASMLLLIHLLLVTGGLAAVTSWRTRVELALLASTGRRLVVVQAVAQLLGVAGAMLLGTAVPLWLAVAAVLALAAAGWVLLAGMRSESPPVRHG
ncbi:hypothetical protein [Georgenia subflava]|uniref:Uncharacterized protein n=1 Tax=Georgenia subflava TaxID=1622177 RepID=A0A6N7EN85_9MICO|nr:hypothetical protein [Georgenia subflava]MPV38337.1 hypothetical protein [Georgenia subflava]